MTAPDDRPLTDFLMNMNLAAGASEQEIGELEEKLKLSLPESYRSILRFTNGVGGGIGPEDLLLYSLDQVLEANAGARTSQKSSSAFIFDSGRRRWRRGLRVRSCG